MLNFCDIVVAILKIVTGRNFSMSGINSGHHYLPTYEMGLKSDNVEFAMALWWPFWKWRPVEIFQCRESIQDIIIYQHIKFWWYRTMLNFLRYCGGHFENGDRNFSMSVNSGHHYLPTCHWYRTMFNLGYCGGHFENGDRYCSMSGINSGHHYLPTYQIVMISDNVDFLRYCGGHFENSDR